MALLVSLGSAIASDRIASPDRIGVRLPASAVYPPHGLGVRFPHAQHSARSKCELCHGGAATSEHAAQDLLPRMEGCGECHPEAADTVDPAACGWCHQGYQPTWPEGEGWLAIRDPRFPLVRPEPAIHFEPNLVFSHLVHRSSPCQSCHLAEADSTVTLPRMSFCVDCHWSREVSASCSTCHLAGEDGRLQTRFVGNRAVATQMLRPTDHTEGWRHGHATALALDPTACFVCHSEQHCLSCHDGVTGIRGIHEPGFQQHHGGSARRSDRPCGACHQVSAFCVNCHIDVGLTDDENHGPPLYDRVHPQGWADVGGGEHSWAAQRNIAPCASCHQETDCAGCHTVVSPHGDQFLSRCGSLVSANPEVCLRCHRATELERLRVRCQ